MSDKILGIVLRSHNIITKVGVQLQLGIFRPGYKLSNYSYKLLISNLIARIKSNIKLSRRQAFGKRVSHKNTFKRVVLVIVGKILKGQSNMYYY